MTNTLTQIKIEKIHGTANVVVNANIHLNDPNLFRINIVGVSGMGQHICILIPAHGIEFVQKWLG